MRFQSFVLQVFHLTQLSFKQSCCFLRQKTWNSPGSNWSGHPVKQTRVYRKLEPANMQINNTPSQRTQVPAGKWPCKTHTHTEPVHSDPAFHTSPSRKHLPDGALFKERRTSRSPPSQLVSVCIISVSGFTGAQ